MPSKQMLLPGPWLAIGYWQELHDRERRHRFAGAGLAYKSEGLAFFQLERHAFDRFDARVAAREGDRKINDLEQAISHQLSA